MHVCEILMGTARLGVLETDHWWPGEFGVKSVAGDRDLRSRAEQMRLGDGVGRR